MSVKKLIVFEFIVQEVLKKVSLVPPIIYKKSRYSSHGELYIIDGGTDYVIATLKENEENKEVICRILLSKYKEQVENIMSELDNQLFDTRGHEYAITMIYE